MERTAVNPVTWSLDMGFNQAELVSGHTRTLYISGQTAMTKDGKPDHDGDIARQLSLAADNLEAVLAEAGMSLMNLVKVNVYTTDIDALFPHYGVLAARLGAAGVAGRRRRGTEHHDARRHTSCDPWPVDRTRRHRGRIATPPPRTPLNILAEGPQSRALGPSAFRREQSHQRRHPSCTQAT